MITTNAPDFADALPVHGRLAGLDVGTKTIGLATCDAGWSFATPAQTLRRTKFTADLHALEAFVAKHGIVGLVVGLPLNLDGSDSPRTQSVRAFARNLAPLALPNHTRPRGVMNCWERVLLHHGKFLYSSKPNNCRQTVYLPTTSRLGIHLR